MSKVVAIIPARAGSKGVPNKNIRELAGKPLLYWSVKAAIDASSVDAVVVTTESNDISDALWQALSYEQRNKTFVYMRPPELAQDHVQVDEVALFTLRQMEYSGFPADTLVILQPPSPFRTAEEIDRALRMHELNDEAGSVISGYKETGYLYQRDYGATVDPINHSPETRLGRQWRSPDEYLFKENGAIYVISASELSNRKNIRVPPWTPLYMDKSSSIDIDTEEDWQRAKEMEHALLER